MYDQQSLRSACAYTQSDQSLCKSLEYSMAVKLLTKHHSEFLSLKGGCTGSSVSTLVKMPHCWKSHAAAHILFTDKVRFFLRSLPALLFHIFTKNFFLSLKGCNLGPDPEKFLQPQLTFLNRGSPIVHSIGN